MSNLDRRICIVAIAVLSVLTAMTFFRGSKQQPQPDHRVEAELKIDDNRFKEFIQRRIASITVSQPDGTLITYDVISEKPKIQDLALTAEKKLTLPDHHGFTELALVSVDDHKATIAYLTKTDFRSFGDNTTSVHAGVVTIDVQTTNP